MWDLDWVNSGYDREFMLKCINKCDCVVVRSNDYIVPLQRVFGITTGMVNEDFNLEMFANIKRKKNDS